MGAVFLAGTGSASAIIKAPCGGSGTIYTTPASGPGPAQWTIQGSGACQAELAGLLGPPVEPQTLTLSGTGTSDSLGLCGGGLLVTNLLLRVDVTFTSTVTHTVTVDHQIWSSPITTFPLATPFLISSPSGTFGAGAMLHHIFLQCGNDGTKPALSFDWVENGSY